MDVLPRDAGGRYLDSRESFHIENNRATPWMIEFRGNIDFKAMNYAVRVLSDRYPILRGRVSSNLHGYWLDVTGGHYPDTVFAKGTKSTCLHMTKAMKKSMYPSLSWFLLVQKKTGGCLVACFSHAIVDAHVSFVYISEFWNIYSRLINGLDVTEGQATGIPKSPSEILQSRNVKCNHIRPMRNNRALPRSSTEEDAGARKDRFQAASMCSDKVILSELETKSFLQYAHYFGVTVGALLVGILAVTIRTQTDSQSPMAIGAAVDHRRILEPPIQETESTCGCVFPRFATVSLANADVVSVAKEFKSALNDQIERRKYQVSGGEIGYQKCSIVLNNYGRIASFSCPRDLELTAFSLVGIVPEKKIRIPAFQNGQSSILSYTFKDRMCIVSNLLDKPDNSISDEFQERCRNADRGFRRVALP